MVTKSAYPNNILELILRKTIEILCLQYIRKNCEGHDGFIKLALFD